MARDRELTDREKDVIRALADANINVSEAARRLFLSAHTVDYHADKIKNHTGLDPKNFYDLCKLLEMVGGAEDGN